MSPPILATKLFIPPLRPQIVLRSNLIEQLNNGLHRKLTLISASAGFGKTTLVSEWINQKDKKNRPHLSKVAWLSLDDGDNDPNRFLSYFIAALQTILPTIGEGVLALLQSPQPLPTESVLTALLNEITATSAGSVQDISTPFILVLDDYHQIQNQAIDLALTFLLDNQPPQMHLVIISREDPPLPLARYRVRGELTELRAANLRFTPDEAADFFNQVMRLNLSSEDIATLESRTEGWIAGLQLAALSIQGNQNVPGFIQSFSGNHHFVLDYLLEEVLNQQPEHIQTFLLSTSILERLCGPLCDAVLRDGKIYGQEILEYLERANLFIIPLDNERRWYRYHHLFGDLLRQRLQHSSLLSVGMDELHRRASQWYEDNNLEIEAFHHAVAAKDIDRAERLIEGNGMPLQYRGAMIPIMEWLSSLETAVLDERPALWVAYALALTMSGQPISHVEEKLQIVEGTLQNAEPNVQTNDLIGQVAAIRAMLAIPQSHADTMMVQSRRALDFLHPDNLPVRTNAAWTLGFAYHLQGDLIAASQAYAEVISISQASGNVMVTLAAATSLGQLQESENQLHLAAENYRLGLQLAGEPPWPAACESYLGLARLFYEWNDLDAAQQHAEQALQLALQMETVDTPAACHTLLARVKLAQGDVVGANKLLSQAKQFMSQGNFVDRMPDVVDVQVRVLLQEDNLLEAARLADNNALPLSQARVHLAQGYPAKAVALLDAYCHEVESAGLPNEQLKVMVLQAVAHHGNGDSEDALQLLGNALTLAQPSGFIRLFVDEGSQMATFLQAFTKLGMNSTYVARLREAFGEFEGKTAVSQSLIDPLSEREQEVLKLLKTDLSGPEIARELMISLNTLRTHTKNIYSKLGVNSRRTAVRRAEELNLI